jgi:hypothetical protein
MHDSLCMQIYKTQRDVMNLRKGRTVRALSITTKRETYNLQSITIWVIADIVPGVPVLHVWHNNKRSIIPLACTKKFYSIQ